MQEITYGDAVRHYQMKTREIYEELEGMRQVLTGVKKQLETAWSGDNAELLQEKLREISQRFQRASENLSEVRQLLEQFQIFVEQ